MIKASMQCVVIAAMSALIAGCSSLSSQPGPPRAMSDCSDDDHCRVQVFVKCPTIVTCETSVDITEIHVHGHNVFWELDDAAKRQFEFDPYSGIRFKTDDGKNNFVCAPSGPGKFHCRNDNKFHGRMEYGVKINGVRRLDPWVVN
jgi:hypothetical protein